MGTLGIVGLDPIGDGIAGLVDTEEQGLVEKLVAHLAAEAARLRQPAARCALPVVSLRQFCAELP